MTEVCQGIATGGCDNMVQVLARISRNSVSPPLRLPQVFDPVTGSSVVELYGHSSPVISLASTGGVLVSGSGDGAIRV